MTRLVGQGDTPHDPLANADRRFDFDPAGGRTFGDDREKARTLDLDERKHGLGTRVAGGGTQDRSDAFKAALKRHDAADGEELPTEAAILMAAQAMRAPERPQALSTPEPVRPSTERVLAVAEACERAMRAELHLQMGRPVSVELGVGDLMPGLERLKISLDGSTLEVAFVLATGAGAAPADATTVAAAQALAEQLQARFPRRTVRVVEIDAGDGVGKPATTPSGAATLSDLFRSGGGA